MHGQPSRLSQGPRKSSATKLAATWQCGPRLHLRGGRWPHALRHRQQVQQARSDGLAKQGGLGTLKGRQLGGGGGLFALGDAAPHNHGLPSVRADVDVRAGAVKLGVGAEATGPKVRNNAATERGVRVHRHVEGLAAVVPTATCGRLQATGPIPGLTTGRLPGHGHAVARRDLGTGLLVDACPPDAPAAWRGGGGY